MTIINIILGLCLICLGVAGIVTNWWAVADFFNVVIPLILVIFGVVSTLAGLSSIKQRKW
jgi:hypothetical protein